MHREFDEVENLLEMWAEWMRKPEPLAEGYPAKASGGFIESWRKDDDEMADRAELQTIEKVNAAYDSLSRYYQEAINRRHSLGANVWRFNDGGATFEQAKNAIRPLFVKKGLL